jgi:hypothetical protein
VVVVVGWLEREGMMDGGWFGEVFQASTGIDDKEFLG